MSLPSSAGGFYPQNDSARSHSHDAIASNRPAAVHGQSHEIYQRATNAQWTLSASSTLRHSLPHHPSPSGSQVSLPERPSPSTSHSMITPYYYDQSDQQAPDVGDYQQWVESFQATHPAGYAFANGHQPADLGHIAYQSNPTQQQHPSMQASMLTHPVMAAGPQNQYHFVPSPYSAEAQAPQPTAYPYHYGAAPARTSPPAGNTQAGYGSHTLPLSEPALSASTMSSHHQPSIHVPYGAAATTSGMATGYSDGSFTFDFPTPGSTGSDPTGNALQSTPSSEQAALPSTPSSRPSTGKQPQIPPAPAANASKFRFVPSDSAASRNGATSKKTAKGKKRVRPNVEEEWDSGSEGDDGAAVPPLKGVDGTPTRLPGACTHCKRLKMKCHFPPNENTCVRCKTSRHICVVEGRRPRNAPNKREYLLAQIRQKDAIIESLLKQLHNPYLATPMSIRSYRMATSPSDQDNKNVRDWLERLEDSVRTAGGSGGPSAFALGSRGDAQGSADEEEDEDDAGAEEREDEPTERGSVGTVKVDEDEKNQSLPDAAVPLGLIAELALTNKNGKGAKGKKAPKDEDDTDDDDVGVANDGYFLPGPANDLTIRAEYIEKDAPPEIVVHGLVTPDDVDKLFEIFFARLNCHVSVLDPVLHTPATTFKRCPFLFTVVCAVASRYHKEKSEIYPIAMHFAKHAAANALITGWKSVELAQAYIILSIYGVPARRWEEDRGWLYTGLAIRIATDLNLHHFPTTKPTNEMQEREMINKVRVWINCYNLDRSTATQFGKPSTIKEDYIVRGSDDWYKMSEYNHPYDIGLCAYTSQLRIVAKFHDEVFSDPDSLTGLNEGLDFHEVTLRHDEALTRYFDDWTTRMRTESDMTDPACAFRASLLPFFTNYSRLVMYSFGCQQAFRRRDGIQESDRLFVDKCFEAAKEVISSMVDSLAPSGFMRYAPDSHFIFGTFASAFLLKLLKPEFLSHNLISKQQEDEIFQLIHRLIQTLQSTEIAIDERHAPRLHARFLTSLLSRYKRDVATTGRLHTQPPPAQDQYGRVPHAAPGQQGQTAPLQQTFSAVPGAPGSDHGMGTSHSSPDSILAEPVYEPEVAYTADAGPLDFDTAMGGEDEVVGALRILNTEAYWQDMMTPGFQHQWVSQDAAYQQQGIPGIHHGFSALRAAGVV